jgi:hypothetical protein
MVEAWAAGLPDKTGRSLDEWITLVNREGPRTEKERRTWLKDQQGLGANVAWWIAERSLKKGWMDEGSERYLKSAEGYVDTLFGGEHAELRPIFEELLNLGRDLGSDVKVCPCQTSVPFYRQRIFASIRPVGEGRVELGLALKDSPREVPPRLAETGGLEKFDRITHRFIFKSVDEIDGEVRRWLKVAYDLDA